MAAALQGLLELNTRLMTERLHTEQQVDGPRRRREEAFRTQEMHTTQWARIKIAP